MFRRMLPHASKAWASAGQDVAARTLHCVIGEMVAIFEGPPTKNPAPPMSQWPVYDAEGIAETAAEVKSLIRVSTLSS